MNETKLYYLGTGTEFIKAQCKEYKTLDGALKAAAKDESLVVWDENGQNEANTASENASEENPEEQQQDTHTIEKVNGTVTAKVVCDGTLNLRRSVSFENGNVCGRASKGQIYYCKAIHTINGKKMIETIDGLFLSGQTGHVELAEM